MENALAIVGGFLGSAVTAVTVLVPVVILWRRTSHRIRQESEASAVLQYEGVIKHLNGELDRLQRQIDRQSEFIGRMSDGLEQCRQEHRSAQSAMDDLYGWLREFHEGWRRTVQRSRRDPDEEVPPLPPRPPRAEGAGFHDRTIAQVGEDLKALRDPPPPAGEHL